MEENRIFYMPSEGRMGDVIPYFEDGEFKLFYLNKGWCSISTKDQLHFYNSYNTHIHGGTGSIVKVDGIYHMFYCKFPNYPYPRRLIPLIHAASMPQSTARTAPSISCTAGIPQERRTSGTSIPKIPGARTTAHGTGAAP